LLPPMPLLEVGSSWRRGAKPVLPTSAPISRQR
jgi:hypothetical protein